MSFSHDARCTILLVDDEAAILSLLTLQLSQAFDVLCAHSAVEARKVMQSHTVDILVADLSLADGTGIELLNWAHKNAPNTARVLLSGTARLQDAAEAINCAQIHRMILKPWRDADLVAHLQDVAHTLKIKHDYDSLVEELQRAKQTLEKRVEERTAQLRTMNNILHQMALTDTLTGLPNRRAIEQIARQELVRHSRNPTPLAIGLVDADNFKDVNTEFTHSGGDQALIGLARVLQDTLRTTDSIGRVGGEEFLIICPSTDMNGVEVLCERLREQVESAKVEYEQRRIPLTISLGFVLLEDYQDTIGFDKLRGIAASALMQAKMAGRNRAVISVAGDALPQASEIDLH